MHANPRRLRTEREREKCAAHFCSDPSSAETERENINEEGGRQAGRQASKQGGRPAGRPAQTHACLPRQKGENARESWLLNDDNKMRYSITHTHTHTYTHKYIYIYILCH
jgi:hypothetical protein